ncbi:MAG: hypothetical protein AAGC55_01405 [Myxococcota bacterium]
MSRAGRILVKTAKIVGALIATLLLAGIAALLIYRHEVSNVVNLPSSYEAKMMCSCLFVQDRTVEFCENFTRQDTIPIQQREIDTAGKSVTVQALWFTNSARYVSERYGCAIDGE